MRFLPAFLCALLGLASCQSAPAYEERSEFGVARADDPRIARDLADMANRFAPQVCRALDASGSEPFVIEYRPARKTNGLYVARDGSDRVVARRIEINEEAWHRQAEYTVAHELVHWYAQGDWDRLPHAIEEGLADYIAIQCVPAFAAAFARQHAADLAKETPELRESALALGTRDWKDAPTTTKDVGYAIGFEIANALGVDGLRALCQRASGEGRDVVPLAWIDDAFAGVSR